MRVFDIDVSGEDILSKNYTICISDNNSLIKGFKVSEGFVERIRRDFDNGLFRYNNSKKGKSDLKVRIYCIIIYYLFKSLKIYGDISLNICRDFQGREDDIKKSLTYFLENKLELKLNERIYFSKLDRNSNAHNYAYLMRFDNKNLMKNYVSINTEDIEIWLKKVPKETTGVSQP